MNGLIKILSKIITGLKFDCFGNISIFIGNFKLGIVLSCFCRIKCGAKSSGKHKRLKSKRQNSASVKTGGARVAGKRALAGARRAQGTREERTEEISQRTRRAQRTRSFYLKS